MAYNDITMGNFSERLKEAELRGRTMKKVVMPITRAVESPTTVIKEPSFADAQRLFAAHALPIFAEIANLKGISMDQDPFKTGKTIFHKFSGGYILPQRNGFIRNDDPFGSAVEGALIWNITYFDSRTSKRLQDGAEFSMLKMRVNPTQIFVHNWYKPNDPRLQEEIIEVISHNGDNTGLIIGGTPFFTPSEPVYDGYSDPGAP